MSNEETKRIARKVMKEKLKSTPMLERISRVLYRRKEKFLEAHGWNSKQEIEKIREEVISEMIEG